MKSLRIKRQPVHRTLRADDALTLPQNEMGTNVRLNTQSAVFLMVVFGNGFMPTALFCGVDGGKVYKSQKYGFQLTIPNSWTVGENIVLKQRPQQQINDAALLTLYLQDSNPVQDNTPKDWPNEGFVSLSVVPFSGIRIEQGSGGGPMCGGSFDPIQKVWLGGSNDASACRPNYQGKLPYYGWQSRSNSDYREWEKCLLTNKGYGIIFRTGYGYQQARFESDLIKVLESFEFIGGVKAVEAVWEPRN